MNRSDKEKVPIKAVTLVFIAAPIESLLKLYRILAVVLLPIFAGVKHFLALKNSLCSSRIVTASLRLLEFAAKSTI